MGTKIRLDLDDSPQESRIEAIALGVDGDSSTEFLF